MPSRVLQLSPFPVSLSFRVARGGPPPSDLAAVEDLGDGRLLATFSEAVLDSDDLVPTAVHEAVHAVDFAEARVGGEFDTETRAYLTEAVFKWLAERAAGARN